jgi:hypothetical protein
MMWIFGGPASNEFASVVGAIFSWNEAAAGKIFRQNSTALSESLDHVDENRAPVLPSMS